MQRKTFLLLTFVLVLGLGGTARGWFPIDDPNYNLSFEYDSSFVQMRCHGDGNLVDVLAWNDNEVNSANCEIDCANSLGIPDCLCKDDYATDGMMKLTMGQWTNPTDQNLIAWQTLDPVYDANVIIKANYEYRVYFDTFWWMQPDLTAYLYYGYMDDSDSLDPDVNVITQLELPKDEKVETSWREEPYVLQFIAEEGQPYIGEPLGIRFLEVGQGWYWIDDVRIWWRSLLQAFEPNPPDKAININLDQILSWSPGLYAQAEDAHDVYFGTSFDDVNDANNTLPPGTSVYKGRQDPNNFDPNIIFKIGETYYWRIDEYSGEECWRGEVWRFTTNDGRAFNPYPEDGEDMASVNVVLEWTPGIMPASHDVYFGTSFDDVNDANTTVQLGVYQGPQALEDTDYDTADEELQTGQTYYWRIDEINDAHPDKMWKGHVWRFRAEDYIVLDDFERYGSTTTLRRVWYDWWKTGVSGASVTLETETVRDEGAMKYTFWNADDWSGEYWSEAYAETDPPSVTPECLLFGRNWIVNGPKTLALWFYGKEENPVGEYDRMSVALEDGDEDYAEVLYYGDMNDIRIEQWQEWNIDLRDFTEANGDLELDDIRRIYIIFGERENYSDPGDLIGGDVWFDDIRLYARRCVPKLAHKTGSFGYVDGDCVTDYNDISALSRDWLMAGYEVSPIEPATPRKWYMLDDGSGTIAEDDGLDGDDGTLGPADGNEHDPEWDDTESSPSADTTLYFDGVVDEGDYVSIPDSGWALGTSNMSITAWIKGNAGGSTEVYQTGGAGIVWTRDREDHGSGLCFGWDMSDWSNNNQLIYCWEELYWDWNSGLIVPEGEWAFVGLSVKPEEATMFLNHADEETLRYATNPAPHHLVADSGTYESKIGDDLAGSKDDPNDMNGVCYIGWISDVRIYDYSLSADEMLYLAQGPTADSFYKSLERWRADADEDDKVDLADFAILADYWLKEVWFPIP
jgi:hypothetical protein